jgi:hypothetical protein
MRGGWTGGQMRGGWTGGQMRGGWTGGQMRGGWTGGQMRGGWTGGQMRGGWTGGQMRGWTGGPVRGGGIPGSIGTSGFDHRGSFGNRGPFVSSGGFVRGGHGHGGWNGGFVRGGGNWGGGHGGYWGGRRYAVGPAHFFHPYYAFRPHLSLGFGLWAGYPFAYPYAFYSPYYYSGSYGSPYYDSYSPVDSGAVEVQPPTQTNMGGVSFEVTPSTAELFVDGTLVGTVGEFTPTTQPLGLTAGRHHLEVRAPGYRTLSVDVDIVAGQVIPYQGTLEQ